MLSGKHRTNVGDTFVFGPRNNEKEWSVVSGYTLSPQLWKKMLRCLPQRLSAGFQSKETQPKVNHGRIHCWSEGVLACNVLERLFWLENWRKRDGPRRL